MPVSPGAVAEQEKNKGETYQPPKDWVEMVVFHRDRLRLVKEARNSPDRHLDNLTFLQDFYSNEDAANSYLRPKRNDDEVRVVGGTTEKRIESIVNELQAMNCQHQIQAFDLEDTEVQGLGKAMEDAVTRTNQLEEDEDVTSEAIWELCIQRGVIVEEILEEKRIGKMRQKLCRKRVRSLVEVLFGDPTMPWYLLQEQPFMATYDRMSMRTAGMFFGKYDNFRYVRGGQDLSVDVYGPEITFRLGILLQDEVEVIRYMSVPDNEYQIYVNGVPMLPPGTELPFQYPFPRYPLSYAIPKRMSHHFVYGRSCASALKYLQAFDDETTRNLIRKFRQAIEPPRAVKSLNRIYTRDLYTSGKISYGVDPDAIKPLTDHDGVTQGEMQMKQLVKGMIDELSARSEVQMGAQPGKKQTATAIVEQQKQAVKMLSQIVAAYSALVRQMAKNRCFNIIENLSEPDGKDVDPSTKTLVDTFRRFTLKDQPLDSGKKGDKILQFVGKDLTEKEHLAISDWEDGQEKKGEPKKLTVVNIRKLRKMSLNWYFTVDQKPKDNDDLHKLMFQDKLSQAGNIAQATGRKVNAERVVAEFEQTWRANDWFEEPEMETQPGLPGGEPGQPGAEGMGSPVPPGSDEGNMGPPQMGGKFQGSAKKGIEAGTRRPASPNAPPKQLMGAV